MDNSWLSVFVASSNAADVFTGLIQTEAPYYKSSPTAQVPFIPQDPWKHDGLVQEDVGSAHHEHF
jgi:hypothetical protein